MLRRLQPGLGLGLPPAVQLGAAALAGLGGSSGGTRPGSLTRPAGLTLAQLEDRQASHAAASSSAPAGSERQVQGLGRAAGKGYASQPCYTRESGADGGGNCGGGAERFDAPAVSRREALQLWEAATARWRQALLSVLRQQAHRGLLGPEALPYSPYPTPPQPAATWHNPEPSRQALSLSAFPQPVAPTTAVAAAAAAAAGGSAAGSLAAAPSAGAGPQQGAPGSGLSLRLRQDVESGLVKRQDRPPWLDLTPDQRQAQLELFRHNQHQHRFQRGGGEAAARALQAVLHPFSSTPHLPFLGMDFAVPATAPALPPADFLDPGSTHLRRLAKQHQDRAQRRPRRGSPAAAATNEEALAAAEEAFSKVELAARKLRTLRMHSTRVAASSGASSAVGVAAVAAAPAAAAAAATGAEPAAEGAMGLNWQAAPSLAAEPAAESATEDGVVGGAGAAGEAQPLTPRQLQYRRRRDEERPSLWLLPALERLFEGPELQEPLKVAMAAVDQAAKHRGHVLGSYLPAPLRNGASQQLTKASAAAVVKLLLKEAKVAPADVLGAISSWPWLLCTSIKARARHNLEILKQHGFSSKPLSAPGGGAKAARGKGSAAGAAPTAAVGAAARKATLGKGAGQQGGQPAQVSSQIGRLVTRAPLLLAMEPEAQLRPLLEYLTQTLGILPDSLERILKQNCCLLGEGGLQRMRGAVAFLYGKLLTQEEVIHVVSRAPKVLSFTPVCLALKFFYLEEALGGSQADVVKCPPLLTASLESVGARVTLAESLGAPILLPSQQKPDSRTLVMSTAHAARKGRDKVDGLSLHVLVADTDKQFAARLGVPLERLRACMQEFRAGAWQEVLQSIREP